MAASPWLPPSATKLVVSASHVAKTKLSAFRLAVYSFRHPTHYYIPVWPLPSDTPLPLQPLFINLPQHLFLFSPVPLSSYFSPTPLHSSFTCSASSPQAPTRCLSSLGLLIFNDHSCKADITFLLLPRLFRGLLRSSSPGILRPLLGGEQPTEQVRPRPIGNNS